MSFVFSPIKIGFNKNVQDDKKKKIKLNRISVFFVFVRSHKNALTHFACHVFIYKCIKEYITKPHAISSEQKNFTHTHNNKMLHVDIHQCVSKRCEVLLDANIPLAIVHHLV